MNNLKKINIQNKKILFLGFGGVAKCVLNYLHYYFKVDYKKIYIIDKCKMAIYGPNLSKILNKNIINMNVTSYTFNNLLKLVELNEGDVIIDLTFSSNTYYFIKACLEEGINYINTSIEDDNDDFNGTSIDLQQKIVRKIFDDYKKDGVVKSNILTEFGQNPGIFQHYMLFALNEMNKLLKGTNKDDYRKKTMIKVIDDYKIGTIFCSEIDNLIKYKDTPMKTDKIYNTWSVNGMVAEAFDKTELSIGLENKYIKPIIPKSNIDFKKMDMLPKYKDQKYEVIFLNTSGMKNKLNSICPILDKDGKIKFVNFNGHLIHHGEMFEMAKYFGGKSPFMTYVYKVNKYADESIKKYFSKNKMNDEADLQMKILSECDSFHVLDNIGKKKEDKIIGHDSIGCTIYCGDKNIDRIFWCGSILSDTDENVDSNFTATIVQVAAGVLTGLSYILESKNKKIGLIEPSDLDTKYVFKKSSPLLGKLFFTEIPKEKFSGKFKYIGL
jgi:homospermidine synthase